MIRHRVIRRRVIRRRVIRRRVIRRRAPAERNALALALLNTMNQFVVALHEENDEVANKKD